MDVSEPIIVGGVSCPHHEVIRRAGGCVIETGDDGHGAQRGLAGGIVSKRFVAGPSSEVRRFEVPIVVTVGHRRQLATASLAVRRRRGAREVPGCGSRLSCI